MVVGTRVTPTMGIDSGKPATVVSMIRIITDGRGIPTLGRGHYKPLNYRTDVAVQFDTGEIDVFAKSTLRRV